jgi:ATP-binding cassette subfamily B protein
MAFNGATQPAAARWATACVFWQLGEHALGSTPPGGRIVWRLERAGAAARPEEGEEPREALQLLLGLEGAPVLAFDNGRPALACLAAHDSAQWPDVLVCDLTLGGIDVIHVVQGLRQIEADRGAAGQPSLPAIALTGLTGESARSRSAQAGFQRHLIKPVAPDELVAQILSLWRAD